MMLWKSRDGRPTTRNGGGRRNSVVEEPKRRSDGLPAHLTGPTLWQAHSIRSLPLERDQQSTGPPTVQQDGLEPQEASQSQEQVGPSVQPNRSSRFSLMKFRQASDPHLSATFAAGNHSPLPSLPSEYSMLKSSLFCFCFFQSQHSDLLQRRKLLRLLPRRKVASHRRSRNKSASCSAVPQVHTLTMPRKTGTSTHFSKPPPRHIA